MGPLFSILLYIIRDNVIPFLLLLVIAIASFSSALHILMGPRDIMFATPETSFFEKACEGYPATMMAKEGWAQTKGAPPQRLGDGQAPQSHIGLGPSYGRPHICGHAKTRFSGQTKNAKNEVRT